MTSSCEQQRSNSALGVSVGTRCYIPDKQRVWLPVVVEDVNEHKCTVTVRLEKVPHSIDDNHGADSTDNDVDDAIAIANAPRRVIVVDDKTVLPLQNTHDATSSSSQHRGCNDMIELNHLHEAAILYNLKTRFHARLPYTYTGDICVALNPYQWLDELYSKSLHAQYARAPSRQHLPPHVYAVAVSAYQHMVQHGTNQSILVSGESGAGKTETTKIVMDNLASIARGTNNVGDNAQEHDSATTRKIIDVTPLLESFGNAKTKRNDNSSRFGKFTQLQFDAATRALVGAKCETYLLEKTRVVTQEPGERNYHIFYQLLHGATSKEQEELALDATCVPSPRGFAYLQADASLVVRDAANYQTTTHALTLLGLTSKEQRALFQALSGILHLGEATFVAETDDASRLELDSVLYSSALLGLDAAAMDVALCNRTMRAGGEVYAVPLRVDAARASRDALAKAIYAKIFDWMVARVNASLSAAGAEEEGDQHLTIGVLDIFGFESFTHNSFEQLCINYANEKLQQKFTLDVFATVYEEYNREQISYAHIEYADNANVLALLESKLGVLALLNEELVRPKGSDAGFVAKLAAQYRDPASRAVVQFARISKTHFTIHHYADSVEYDATGFLEKHKDALLPDLSELVSASAEPFVQLLFAKSEESAAAANAAAPDGSGPLRRGRSGDAKATATVGTQFKQSLTQLMATIERTNVHYIRCIKPNSVKSPTVLDESMVVNQLRCAGVIEAISIARAGYPNRLLHAAFVTEFELFLVDAGVRTAQRTATTSDSLDPVTAQRQCHALTLFFALTSPLEFQMGTTKIYLQKGILERLAHAKARKLFAFAACIQSGWRGVCARRRVAAMRVALALLQRRCRGFAAKTKFQRQRRAAATIQRVWRGHVGRQIYFAALCESRAQQIQRVWRGHKGRRIYFAARCVFSAVRIQCAFRQSRARRALAQRRDAFATEQARLREVARLQKLEQARLLRVLQAHSAVVIQSRVRGLQARRAFVAAVEAAAAKRRQEEAEREQQRQQAIAAERERLAAIQRAQEEAERKARAAREAAEREAQAAREAAEREVQAVREAAERKARAAREAAEREALQHAVVVVQKVTRGRLARQKCAVLRIEADAIAEPIETPALAAARATNARLRLQLAELLDANVELENLVTEWQCEREVLDASNHVKALDLRQRISNRQQQLDVARLEHSSLSDQLQVFDKSACGNNSSRMRSHTETNDSNGSTADTETLSSASEPEDDDNDVDNNNDSKSSSSRQYSPNDAAWDDDFAADRPSRDVAHLLAQRESKPSFSNTMQQRAPKPGQLFRAGAKQLGIAKKWVNTTRRTGGKAAKVHGELAVKSPLPPRGIAL